MCLLNLIASDYIIDQAFAWLCKRRFDYSHNNDVWELRFRWDSLKPQLQAALLSGEYRFSPLQRIYTSEGEVRDLWSAADSLVLKTITLVLGNHLDKRLSPRCFHLAGNGGVHAAVREAYAAVSADSFIMKSDVKSHL